jgi:hypothetical protein
MKFVNTDRFSPVINEGDLPWEHDLFHHESESLPATKSDLDKFITKNDIEPDVEYWNKQRERCFNGYTINDAIEKGGDVFIDGWDSIWNETAKPLDYTPGIIIPPESVYMPEYDLVIPQGNLTISGKHYWYLNYWIIYGLKKGGKIKENVNPRFLDIDFGFFSRVEHMIRKAEGHLQETKTRQKGFSEKMASILGFFFTWYKGSQNIVAGGMSDDAEKTFTNAIRGLDGLRNTQFYKQRSKNDISKQYIEAKYGKGFLTAISCKDNAQAISRHTPTVVIYEEDGKWKKGLLSKAREFVKVSLKAEGKQTGFGIALGTGGDMELGAADLEKMHYNPDRYNNLRYRNKWEREPVEGYSSHFTPGWQYKIIDKDGNSLKAPSLELMVVEEAEAKEKSDEEQYVYQTQNANYAADAFRISGGLFFGATITNFCNERKAQITINRSEQRVKRGWLRWKYGLKQWRMGVKWEEDPTGPFLISELPRTYRENGEDIVFKNLYGVATDSYDQDEAKTSSSKGSCWVKKKFRNANESYNKVVAGILIRPETSEGGRETFYEYTALLTAFYNGINLIEHKNILIFDWYHRHGLTPLLKERPGVMISKYVKNSQTSNVYGIDGAFLPHALKILKDNLNNRINVFNIDFIEILEAIARFRLHKDYNCDITVALAYLETLMEDEAGLEVMKDQEEEITAPSYKYVNGELILC